MSSTVDQSLVVGADDGLKTIKIQDSNAESLPIAPLTGSLQIDTVAERRLVWKFDLRILPVITVMYFFNALDKSNLGNAKTAGLEGSLGLTGDQYNLVLSIFFIPYVLTAPGLGFLGKKYGPNRVLPLMMATFGFATTMTVVVKDFSGLMAIRWFLGMAESAFFPLVIYYQTTFYRRGELARRLGIFYAAASIAYAFGGLISYGVFQIAGGPLDNWRYLFLIEGLLSMVFAVFAYWYLPLSATEAKFLSPDERELAFYRLQLDSSSIVNEPFNFSQAVSILKHPTSWVILGIEICLGVPLQSVALYLPVIVGRLGLDTVLTNLYTVAPNISGAVVLVILAFASDSTRLRFPFIALGFILSFIGFIIYAAIDVESQLHAAYFSCFMMTWGTSAPSVLLDAWYNNNIANENKRLLLTSLGVPLANLMGLISSNIFQARDAPKYVPALATTGAFGVTGAMITLGLGSWMVLDNRKRDKSQGVKLRAQDVPTERLRDGPAVAEYRWFL